MTSTLTRPPIVAVLGHVDHGKTTLLDAIRQTNVAGGEFGGITQHIGAYQVDVKTKNNVQKITFIDTPGHEAFSKMRSRGAQITDVVVLVVDGVKGVQPQTEESIAHIKKAGVPFIVAATKMDLPQANLDRVKKHLVKAGVGVEGLGGDTVVVPVSATQKKGLDNLLEMIILVVQLHGIKGDANDPLNAVVIESRLDNKRGPLATILVKAGILNIADDIYLEEEKIRVRAMFDENGKGVSQALPSKAVEVMGFKSAPPVGSILTRVKSKIKDSEVAEAVVLPPILFEEENKLKLILNTDTVGSMEAISGKLGKDIKVVETALGEIKESQVANAQSAKAIIIGFNVRVNKNARKIADLEGVLIKTYNIIYDLLEEVEEVARLVIEGTKDEISGSAKVIAQFSTSQGNIAGLIVVTGKITKGDQVKLMRGDKEIGQGRILTLRKGKEEVSKVVKDEECGAKLSSKLDFLIGDMILSIKDFDIKLK